jgi:hypothetical protein
MSDPEVSSAISLVDFGAPCEISGSVCGKWFICDPNVYTYGGVNVFELVFDDEASWIARIRRLDDQYPPAVSTMSSKARS